MTGRPSVAPALTLLALALACATAVGADRAAQATVIYRCVAADGAVTVQNTTKCPKGARSQRRVIDPPRLVPTPVLPVAVSALAPVTPVPASLRPAPPAATPSPAPAPALFACSTRDEQHYFGDESEPTRCAPMSAVGLDGSSPVDAAACESVRDTCTAVPEAERCAAWDERRRVAESALQFEPEKFDAAREELERVRAATAATVCAH